jgi:hypothetical protein
VSHVGLDFARRAVAWDMVHAIATRLAVAGIRVAPLKGALISARYLGPDVPRPMTDIDILVPGERFDEACELLLSDGGRRMPDDRDDRTASMVVPWGPLPIDLHRRLFQRGLFRVDEGAMIERAELDERLFRAPVLLLHPCDVIAHAIGHHAAGRPLVEPERLRVDLDAVMTRSSLDLDRLRDHLARMGLGRGVHFAERDLRGRPLAWLTELDRRLAPSLAGRVATELALRLARGPSSERGAGLRRASFAKHLVNDGFARGLYSAAVHGAQSAARLSRAP